MAELTPAQAKELEENPEQRAGSGRIIEPEVGVWKPPSDNTWNPAPIIKQILNTPVPGIPPFLPSQNNTPASVPTYNPLPILKQIAETKIPGTPEKKESGEIKIPGSTEIKEDAADSSSKEFKIAGSTEIKEEPPVSSTPSQNGQKPEPGQIQIPGSTELPATTAAPLPAGQTPPQQQPPNISPPPPPPLQQPLTVPTPTPQGPTTVDPHELQQVLVAQGLTAGQAQAVAAGRIPKTISGDTPPPPKAPPVFVPSASDERIRAENEKALAQLPAAASAADQPPVEAKPLTPVDTLKADDKNRVDPVSLYRYLLGKFANSPLVNYIPPDGDYWKIKTGSAAEWAAFGLAVAKQESDLNTRSYNSRDPGGSVGLFQFGQGQTQFTGGADQYNPQAIS